MKYLKIILPLALLLLVVTSCQKIKLEEDEETKVLIGKWDHQSQGYWEHSTLFLTIFDSKQDYTIEFLEGGKVCVNDAGETETYRITNTSVLESNQFGLWRRKITCKKGGEGLYFDVNYYGEDSIMINNLPTEVFNIPDGEIGLNHFKRIE